MAPPLLKPEILITSKGMEAIASSLNVTIARLQDLEPVMLAAAGKVYEGTAMWYDSNGEGSWDPLAASTIKRKMVSGVADPSRPLFKEGDLYESATTPSGRWSRYIPGKDSVVVGIMWRKGNYNIARVLSGGTEHSGRHGRWRHERGLSGTGAIPARPIFPPIDSMAGRQIMLSVGHLLADWIGVGRDRAFPGAQVGRGAGGRFISLKDM